MTAIDNTYRRPTIPPIILLLLALAAALFFTLIVAGNGVDLHRSHAAKHGSDAELVRACLDERERPDQLWWNPETGRYINVCFLPDGRFGLQILGRNLDEITSYIKEKCKRLKQVERYLSNRGYQNISK